MHLQIARQADPLLLDAAVAGEQEKGHCNEGEQDDQKDDHRVKQARLLRRGLELWGAHGLLPFFTAAQETPLANTALCRAFSSAPRH